MTIFDFEKIKKKQQFYMIAEIGVNHECSLKKAKKLISQAKSAGAHAAKFQTYKADKIASKFSKAYWDTSKEKTKSQHQLFSKFDKFTSLDYIILAKYCKKINIDFLSTPFDSISVDFLKKLVPIFKISSSDISNVPLLRKISSIGKPVLLSTGGSNISEIKNAIKNLNFKKKLKNVLMHCILNYPTKDSNANLLMIKHLSNSFKNYPIGYYDHTLPNKKMSNISIAYLMGARVIEKHFTYNKKLKGNDHYHAMDVEDLKKITENIKGIDITLGNSKKNYLKSEILSRKNARRGIFVAKIKKNEKITHNKLITLRPNIGIPASDWDKVLNKRAKMDLKKGANLNGKHKINYSKFSMNYFNK